MLAIAACVVGTVAQAAPRYYAETSLSAGTAMGTPGFSFSQTQRSTDGGGATTAPVLLEAQHSLVSRPGQPCPTCAPILSSASVDAAARVEVGPGAVRIHTSVLGNGDRPNPGPGRSDPNGTLTAGAVGYGEFGDRFTIDGGPALAGKIGHLDAYLRFDGVLSGGSFGEGVNGAYHQLRVLATVASTSGLAGGSWSLSADHNEGYDASAGMPPSGSGRPYLPFGEIPVSLDFVFGVPVAVSLKLTVTTHGQASLARDQTGGFRADGDLGHTFAWNGIDTVSQGGVALRPDQLGIVGESGLDYRFAAAVPEPPPAALGWLGLMGLLAHRRRTRHAGRPAAG